MAVLCHFYAKLDQIFGERPDINPPHTVGTLPEWLEDSTVIFESEAIEEVVIAMQSPESFAKNAASDPDHNVVADACDHGCKIEARFSQHSTDCVVH